MTEKEAFELKRKNDSLKKQRKKYKWIFKDMIDALEEGMNKKRKEVLDKIGIEPFNEEDYWGLIIKS